MTEALINAEAQNKLQEVYELVGKLAKAESQLEYGYAKLAFLLHEVATYKYWVGAFESYGDFLSKIQETYGVSKSQLYNYRSAAAELEGAVTVEQLNTMGISKALVLRSAKKNTGAIPDGVLDQAVDKNVSVQDLKQLLYDAKAIEKPEDGKWVTLDFSSYYTEEEAATLKDGLSAAFRGDPAIPETLPKMIRMKQALLKFVTEFLGAHAKDAVEQDELEL
jgi:hypothetical protein